MQWDTNNLFCLALADTFLCHHTLDNGHQQSELDHRIYDWTTIYVLTCHYDVCWRCVHCLPEDSTNSYRTSDGVVGGLSHDPPQQQLWVEVPKYKGSVNATHCHQIWYVQPNSLKHSHSHTASYRVPSRLCGAVHCTTAGERGISSFHDRLVDGQCVEDDVLGGGYTAKNRATESGPTLGGPTAATFPYLKL